MITCDDDLFALIKSATDAGLLARAIDNVKVKQKYQRLQQGQVTAPGVYMFKIGDKRVGSPARQDVWNAGTSKFDHTEKQMMESTFQINAVVSDIIPDGPTPLSASDLVNVVADIMQGDDGLAVFRAAGVGVLRIPSVTNPFDVDDRTQFAAAPSFDLLLTYTRARVSNVPVVTSIDYRTGVHGV